MHIWRDNSRRLLQSINLINHCQHCRRRPFSALPLRIAFCPGIVNPPSFYITVLGVAAALYHSVAISSPSHQDGRQRWRIVSARSKQTYKRVSRTLSRHGYTTLCLNHTLGPINADITPSFSFTVIDNLDSTEVVDSPQNPSIPVLWCKRLLKGFRFTMMTRSRIRNLPVILLAVIVGVLTPRASGLNYSDCAKTITNVFLENPNASILRDRYGVETNNLSDAWGTSYTVCRVLCSREDNASHSNYDWNFLAQGVGAWVLVSRWTMMIISRCYLTLM